MLENRQLRLEVHQRYSFHNIIGRSPPKQRVIDVVSRVADTRTSVLITGESGTGKELIAKALHHNSSRKDAAMVTVNCGAIPENLMESELFGHVKGAFTGALSNKTGMFAAASAGSTNILSFLCTAASLERDSEKPDESSCTYGRSQRCAYPTNSACRTGASGSQCGVAVW